jgi:hypothetical protein
MSFWTGFFVGLMVIPIVTSAITMVSAIRTRRQKGARP